MTTPTPDHGGIERFDFEVDCYPHCYGGTPKPVPCDYGEGEFVRYEDHAAALAAKDAEIVRLTEERNEALAWSESDAPLPIDDEVKSVKPSRSRDPIHSECWRLAQSYVSAKRSKYALVDLLSWALIGGKSAERERDEARRERDEAVAILRDFERYTGWDAKARAKKLARAARMEEALLDLRSDLRTMAEREEGLWRHYFERVEAALAPADDGEGATSSPWRPMRTAPTDGTEVLLAVPTVPVLIGSHMDNGDGEPDWFSTCGAHLVGSMAPTGWQPLPEVEA